MNRISLLDFQCFVRFSADRTLTVNFEERFLPHFQTKQTVFYLEIKTKYNNLTSPEKKTVKKYKTNKLPETPASIIVTTIKQQKNTHVDEASRCVIAHAAGYLAICEGE